MNVSTDGLPPEMQARIAEIIEKAKTNVQPGVSPSAGASAPAAQAPIQRPPSLMDHVVALRQEVHALREELAQATNQVAATAQVTEAVGGAVGQLYSMFFEQSQTPTYSSTFQAQEQLTDNDDY